MSKDNSMIVNEGAQLVADVREKNICSLMQLVESPELNGNCMWTTFKYRGTHAFGAISYRGRCETHMCTSF